MHCMHVGSRKGAKTRTSSYSDVIGKCPSLARLGEEEDLGAADVLQHDPLQALPALLGVQRLEGVVVPVRVAAQVQHALLTPEPGWQFIFWLVFFLHIKCVGFLLHRFMN